MHLLVGFKETFLKDAASERSGSTAKATFMLAEYVRFFGPRRIPTNMCISSKNHWLLFTCCRLPSEGKMELEAGLISMWSSKK